MEISSNGASIKIFFFRFNIILDIRNTNIHANSFIRSNTIKNERIVLYKDVVFLCSLAIYNTKGHAPVENKTPNEYMRRYTEKFKSLMTNFKWAYR